MSLARGRYLDAGAAILSRNPTTSLSHYTRCHLQQRRHYICRYAACPPPPATLVKTVRPTLDVTTRPAPLATIRTARTRSLNTEASQGIVDSAIHAIAASAKGRSKHHHDVDTFLKYAVQTNLSENTTYYRGTYHEYNAAGALEDYGFALDRVGRANDLGIDLLGQWNLPMAPHEIKIVAQCRATHTRPAMVRELEGACQGAPLGWRGKDVMALLISDRSSTRGVREAIQRSSLPIGFMLITDMGFLQQFFWNPAATNAFLTGMEAMPLYHQKVGMEMFCKREMKFLPCKDEKHDTVALLWQGKHWKP
ncbi:hypothetical protein CLAFUW4_03602 [Fulvia fulva]|uniref:Required for respiratory growth protein 7, mitochondrial n=1 Tax=Passalora fulva TaxID=5499 RepID=A0A9Q8LA65_PASFU|nr:uncharacterized protein CLAFUR5_03582 [Fulvia fulva]KAK4631735.1 hypothetical protein CLAFUR4_03590 [Fulvia fulva]KAK4632751.1 hypothetical protein CLAFUR0_03593 [Fulvia fulva]UJO13687.1 hypothetical protein CLAFUR5_03582 [Fulvia fulva]WPV11989.1 hypothetical protein CLAFUW4_03602 [Fulvia fulva]WPV25653.1 hypothetical protein CLAFUW7_03594 [Fulvia fulva]